MHCYVLIPSRYRHHSKNSNKINQNGKPANPKLVHVFGGPQSGVRSTLKQKQNQTCKHYRKVTCDSSNFKSNLLKRNNQNMLYCI